MSRLRSKGETASTWQRAPRSGQASSSTSTLRVLTAPTMVTACSTPAGIHTARSGGAAQAPCGVETLTTPALRELAALDDAAFRTLFTASPVKRIGRDRFLRNVLMAIGNSGKIELADCAVRLLTDTSPLVRGAAIWAASRLLPRQRMSDLADRHRANEADASVISEWEMALAASH